MRQLPLINAKRVHPTMRWFARVTELYSKFEVVVASRRRDSDISVMDVVSVAKAPNLLCVHLSVLIGCGDP